MTNPKRRLLIRLFLLCLILVFGVIFARKLDVAQLAAELRAVSLFAVAGVLATQGLVQLFGALQWKVLLRAAGIGRRLSAIYAAKVGGFAVGYLSPPMSFAGDVVRTRMLRDDRAGLDVVAGTVAADKLVEIAGKLPGVLAGIGLVFIPGTLGVLRYLIVASIALGALAGLMSLVVMVSRIQSRGAIPYNPLRPLAALLIRVRPRAAVRVTASGKRLGMVLRRIASDRRAFLASLGFACLVNLVEMAQIGIVLASLGIFGIDRCVVLYATILVQGTVGVLPGNLGGMEGTNLFAFVVLGLGSTPALVYTAVIRFAQAGWVAGGFGCLAFRKAAGLRCVARRNSAILAAPRALARLLRSPS